MDELASLRRIANETPSDWGLRLIAWLSVRHQRKSAVPIERLIAELEGLREEPEVVLDFILAEWTLRRQAGEQIVLSEYVERFPDREPELRALWDVDQETPFSDRSD